jgi:hypothetical protein
MQAGNPVSGVRCGGHEPVPLAAPSQEDGRCVVVGAGHGGGHGLFQPVQGRCEPLAKRRGLVVQVGPCPGQEACGAGVVGEGEKEHHLPPGIRRVLDADHFDVVAGRGLLQVGRHPLEAALGERAETVCLQGQAGQAGERSEVVRGEDQLLLDHLAVEGGAVGAERDAGACGAQPGQFVGGRVSLRLSQRSSGAGIEPAPSRSEAERSTC